MELLERNPLSVFVKWHAEAVASGEKLPDAMTLATASRKATPSVRVVLYKGLSKGAFRIFTNLESRKGQELLSNPQAALCFHWKTLDRQVRIEGRIFQMPRAAAKAYFHSRPRMSQIGAWASNQSRPIESREALMDRVRHFETKFDGIEVPLPPHWGGFLLKPARIEFWVDGAHRLHDRFLFSKSTKTARWVRQRLSP